MATIVKVIGAADGRTCTPHDGRYVVSWNPHTRAGTLELTSTGDKTKARRFNGMTAFEEWRMISRVQSQRPWDGQPNRPLTGITCEFSNEVE